MKISFLPSLHTNYTTLSPTCQVAHAHKVFSENRARVLIYFFIYGKIDEEGVIIIINLKLIRENGDVRFKAYGNEIDEVFHGEYEVGDKFRVELCDSEFVKLRLDDTLAESIVYVPDGVFEYIVPHGKERKAGYAPEAFGGDCHRIRVSEPTEAEIYGERLISLNSHDRHNSNA